MKITDDLVDLDVELWRLQTLYEFYGFLTPGTKYDFENSEYFRQAMDGLLNEMPIYES